MISPNGSLGPSGNSEGYPSEPKRVSNPLRYVVPPAKPPLRSADVQSPPRAQKTPLRLASAKFGVQHPDSNHCPGESSTSQKTGTWFSSPHQTSPNPQPKPKPQLHHGLDIQALPLIQECPISHEHRIHLLKIVLDPNNLESSYQKITFYFELHLYNYMRTFGTFPMKGLKIWVPNDPNLFYKLYKDLGFRHATLQEPFFDVLMGKFSKVLLLRQILEDDVKFLCEHWNNLKAMAEVISQEKEDLLNAQHIKKISAKVQPFKPVGPSHQAIPEESSPEFPKIDNKMPFSGSNRPPRTRSSSLLKKNRTRTMDKHISMPTTSTIPSIEIQLLSFDTHRVEIFLTHPPSSIGAELQNEEFSFLERAVKTLMDAALLRTIRRASMSNLPPTFLSKMISEDRRFWQEAAASAKVLERRPSTSILQDRQSQSPIEDVVLKWGYDKRLDLRYKI